MFAPFEHINDDALAALEAFIAERASWGWLMAHRPFDGRPAVVQTNDRERPVNGQEVRASVRWASQGRAYRPADDWTCYTVRRLPFGRIVREPFQPSQDRKTTRRTSARDVGGDYFARVAAFGADDALAAE